MLAFHGASVEYITQNITRDSRAAHFLVSYETPERLVMVMGD
jgi:hypothetical protein